MRLKIYVMDPINSYYQHFKGGLYKLLYLGRDSETLEEVVVYEALYGDKSIWVRPKKLFFEEIEINNKRIPRFRKLTNEELLCLQKESRNT